MASEVIMVSTVRARAGCAASPELLASGWVNVLGRVHAMAKHDGTECTTPRRRYAVGDSPTMAGERPTERSQAAEPGLEADVGDRAIRRTQQEHRPLDPTPLQIAVRRLAEHGAERADEMGLGHDGDAGQRGNVERLGIGAVHRVAGPQHPPVGVLRRPAHRPCIGSHPAFGCPSAPTSGCNVSGRFCDWTGEGRVRGLGVDW